MDARGQELAMALRRVGWEDLAQAVLALVVAVEDPLDRSDARLAGAAIDLLLRLELTGEGLVAP